ncbi:MAG: hypothetical protein HY094_02090 [Candidatus Melainabacteria bacterium]|nr:hypothetical protein [Candidatus Melainabacteria bacterium]
MKHLQLIFIFLLFSIFLFCEISPAEEIEIKHADLLQADKEQIQIMGNVIINYKEAIIEAPGGVIENDKDGEQNKAIFSGRAKLKLKDRMLEADKIEVSIKDKTIHAEGSTISKLKDKKNDWITIFSDYQELHWSGENANAKGNITTLYQDTKVTSDEVRIIYKSKKPSEAVFTGYIKPAHIEQPTNITSAEEFIVDLNTNDLWATGNVNSKVWANKKSKKSEQDLVYLNAEDLFIEKATGTVVAKSKAKKVLITYQETKGESTEATLLRDKATNNPERILFKGNANVAQEDKQISSEEVVFNFKDKKLTSNTRANIRPKTLIFKK